jgi:hypothetical protein
MRLIPCTTRHLLSAPSVSAGINCFTLLHVSIKHAYLSSLEIIHLSVWTDSLCVLLTAVRVRSNNKEFSRWK